MQLVVITTFLRVSQRFLCPASATPVDAERSSLFLSLCGGGGGVPPGLSRDVAYEDWALRREEGALDPFAGNALAGLPLSLGSLQPPGYLLLSPRGPSGERLGVTLLRGLGAAPSTLLLRPLADVNLGSRILQLAVHCGDTKLSIAPSVRHQQHQQHPPREGAFAALVAVRLHSAVAVLRL